MTTNINPSKGIANGVRATLSSLEWATEERRVEALEWLRDNPDGDVILPRGLEPACVLVRPDLREEVEATWPTTGRLEAGHVTIPIPNEKDEYELVAGATSVLVEVTRPAYDFTFASTIHKCQGATLERVIYSLLKRPCRPSREDFHSIYVAITRVRDGDDLRILIDRFDELDFIDDLRPPPDLLAFLAGYDASGKWREDLALAALDRASPAAGEGKKRRTRKGEVTKPKTTRVARALKRIRAAAKKIAALAPTTPEGGGRGDGHLPPPPLVLSDPFLAACNAIAAAALAAENKRRQQLAADADALRKAVQKARTVVRIRRIIPTQAKLHALRDSQGTWSPFGPNDMPNVPPSVVDAIAMLRSGGAKETRPAIRSILYMPFLCDALGLSHECRDLQRRLFGGERWDLLVDRTRAVFDAAGITLAFLGWTGSSAAGAPAALTPDLAILEALLRYEERLVATGRWPRHDTSLPPNSPSVLEGTAGNTFASEISAHFALATKVVAESAHAPLEPPAVMLGPPIGEHGLSNFANHCYANSVLQCLRSLQLLLQACWGKDPRVPGLPLTQRAFLWFLASVGELRDATGNPVFLPAASPSANRDEVRRTLAAECPPTWSALSSWSPNWNNATQQDASEFLGILLTKLCSSLLALRLAFTFRMESKAWTACGDHEQTVYPSVGSGLINVPIPSNSASTLVDNLEILFGEESLDSEYQCTGCTGKHGGTKRNTLTQLPNVLTLSLGRFTHTGGAIAGAKISRAVTVPDSLDMSSNCSGEILLGALEQRHYDLAAVIHHSGSAVSSGHYYASCKNSDGNWRRFNDETVESITFEKAVLNDASAQPYILFYVRRQAAL